MSTPTEHFDAVVVGSGFGGSVSAYRLAEGGLSVCLLERGKAYPPGSFPRTPHDMARNFWDPSEGRHGMFDLWTFNGLEALVSAGLGGGSLIYANVLLRKDESWFVNEEGEDWPVTRSDLDPHYDRVERMIEPTPYPFAAAPYSETPKTRAMQRAANDLGLDWALPPLAVTFAGGDGAPPRPGDLIHEGDNLHGLPRFTCRLCGECDIGCNFGSKNSLDYNYLSAFTRLGGEIRTRSEVRSFVPAGAGFEVRYVTHEPDREGQETDTRALPETTITADRLVLAAGALGTPFLLLKNAQHFPALAQTALGSRFCGNGDLLAFITKGVSTEGGRRRALDPSIGPVITSRIRYPDARDGGGASGRGFYIQEGGYPQFASWLVEMTEVRGRPTRAVKFLYRRVRNLLSKRPISNVSGEVSELLGDCVKSSGSLPLLGMGRDVPDGNMRLRDGYLEVDWTTRTSRAYFDGVKSAMQALADSLDARFTDSPLWYFRRVITVHPLGGAPMARSPETGVVDAYGQVFDLPGLSIADGSVLPGPVGPNPSLTIAALADRFADRTLEQHRR